MASVNALILADGHIPQYKVLKCSHAAGVKAYVAGSGTSALLVISRFCAGHATVAFDAPDHDGKSIARINDLIRRWSIDCIIPADAPSTRFISLHRSRLNAPAFKTPDTEIFDELDSKDSFAKLCGRLNLPHPVTKIFSTPDDLATAIENGDLALPIMVKPINRSGGVGIVKIELTAATPDLTAIRYQPVLTQAFIGGSDVCASVYCSDGMIRQSICYTRSGGKCRFVENEVLVSLIAILVNGCHISGVLNFDFRISNDGNIFFLECNPRFWYTMDTAMVAGFNFVAFGLQDLEMIAPGHDPATRKTSLSSQSPASNGPEGRRPRRGDCATLTDLMNDPLYILMDTFRRLVRKLLTIFHLGDQVYRSESDRKVSMSRAQIPNVARL